MIRSVLVALVALAAAAPVAGAAVPPGAAGERLLACHTGADPAARYLTVSASMRSLPGTARMRLRFYLYRRLPGSLHSTRVYGPGLGSWNDAASGVAGLRFRKTIANLPVPGIYRVVVRYAWLDADGQTVAAARRVTAPCVQPDLRPDLRVGGLTAAPGADPGTRTYLVVVQNDGRSRAGSFEVALRVPAGSPPPVTVSGLRAGARREVSIAGPRCQTGDPVQVTVDPGNRVDESVEGNNVRTFTCP
jgi:CARDB